MIFIKASFAEEHFNTVEILRDEANRFYKIKKYDQACSLYDDATRLAPTRGELWSDLGLCLFKMDKKEEAKNAEIKAIEYGSPKVRLHAYYNLFKIGVRLPVPENGCMEWSCSRSNCSKDMAVCLYIEHCFSGTGVTIQSTGLSFCPAISDAQIFTLNCSASIPSCFAIELKNVTKLHCRPWTDVILAPCEESIDSAACEEAVKNCLKLAWWKKSISCTFVYVDAELQRVGAVCDGKALELSPANYKLLEALDPLSLNHAGKNRFSRFI